MTSTDKKTEYRTVQSAPPTMYGLVSTYLQFRSKERKRCFPKIWKTEEVECWRFIPDYSSGGLSDRYLEEENCPTTLPGISSHHFVSPAFTLFNFSQKYPCIDDYFKEINERRERFLAEKH